MTQSIKSSVSFFILIILILQSNISAQRANLALGKPVTSNDTEPESSLSLAVDGNYNSHWSSKKNNPGPWHIIIDLEDQFIIDSLFLQWELAAAEHFTIELSIDTVAWTTVADESNFGLGPFQNSIIIPKQHARFIKINCLRRSTVYGYSLYEAEVFGKTPIDWVSNIHIDSIPNFIQVNNSIQLNASLLNGNGDLLIDKSQDIQWSIVDNTPELGDLLSIQSGPTTSFTTSEPYRSITIAAEYTDSQYSGFTFTDSQKVYINPDPQNFHEAVRCDMISKADTCVSLNELNTTLNSLPKNITRLAEKGLNICLPNDALITQPINIVFAIDMSGSMYGTKSDSGPNDPEFLTPIAVRRAIDTIHAHAPQSNVGFLGFSGGVCSGDTSQYNYSDWSAGDIGTLKPDTRVPPKMLDENQLALLYNQTMYSKENHWFNCGDIEGGTAYTSPLTSATEWLEAIDPHNINRSIIIFFTDGEPTATHDTIANYHLHHDSTNHPRVFTVALVDTINEDLQQLVNNTKGLTITIDDAAEADEAIQIVLQNAISTIEPSNFTISNNEFSYTTNQFNALNIEKKMYKISGQQFPLTEGLNTVYFHATSLKDTNSNYSSTLTLDISGDPLTEIGRHRIDNTTFDAVCYEPAHISVENNLDHPIDTIKSYTEQFNIILSTQSTGFTPQITLSTIIGENETVLLNETITPYKSDFLSALESPTPTKENSIIEITNYEELFLYWKNPFDPRDTARSTLETAIPEFVPTPDIIHAQSSFIYDSNSDGIADKIIVTFDNALEAAPTTIWSIDWAEEGNFNISKNENEFHFLQSDTGLDKSKIVIEFENSPFGYGITTASAHNPPYLNVFNDIVLIEDRIGPVIVNTNKNPSHYKQYAIQHNIDSISYHVIPDTLVVTLSEAITIDQANIMQMLTVIHGDDNTVLSLAATPTSEDNITWVFLLDNNPNNVKILVGDSITLNPNIDITDASNNKSQRVANIVLGENGIDNRFSSTFREVIVKIEGTTLNEDLTTAPIPIYNEAGDLIVAAAAEGTSIKLEMFWVPPVHFSDINSSNHSQLSSTEECYDTQVNTPYPKGCIASHVVLSQKEKGPYSIRAYIFNNIGQYITSLHQSFGYCGEFDNEYRIAQTENEGLFMNDIIWDLKDDTGRSTASGVYLWVITLTYDTGEVLTIKRNMGMLRNDECF
ncbi:MAG: discoidin domain-containing protein [Reichenbachiella sp.]